ncbi:unnamed protein product [Phytophthora fragariaefolia]|uniref:Unnamed protein product n=1 Tax=Phytophthora fragariaefolia TaxID=1490495 RepID=A0A9W6Y2J3_9STRA|nr:unnamed protein product [Phytophthora fragariaefolia]
MNPAPPMASPQHSEARAPRSQYATSLATTGSELSTATITSSIPAAPLRPFTRALQSPSAMDARDAIVEWLERGDNFPRATAASPRSPRARRRAHARDVDARDEAHRAVCVQIRGEARRQEAAQGPAKTKLTTGKQQEQASKHEHQAVVPAPPVIELPSDAEEEPAATHSTRAARRSSSKPTGQRPGEASPAAKRARHESASKTTGGAAQADRTPTRPTPDAGSSASGKKTSDENAGRNARGHDEALRRGLNGNARAEHAPTDGTQRAEPPQQRHSPPKAAAAASIRNHQQNSAAGFIVPDAYRSAIAQVISQREELLSRMGEAEDETSPIQQRYQRSLSESDYGLSDIDLHEADTKPNTPRDGSRNFKPAPQSQHELGPTAGLLPLLIDDFCIPSGEANLERKRLFLSAKKLAFEQLEWYRENELQQCELELLHREMQARETFAMQEIKLERMRVRADTIQHMVAAGASVADIAERLRLL